MKPLTVINYTCGDATRPIISGPVVIAHVCNDEGKWGRGFVLAISRRWKLPEKEYRAWAAGGNGAFQLGEVQFVSVADRLWVANMIGQHGVKPKAGVSPLRCAALESALHRVADFCAKHQASAHMPRIGCGLAGGDWTTVSAIVESTLIHRGIPVTVYDLPRQNQ